MNNGTKLIIGAGGIVEPGFESFEQGDLDVTNAAHWARLFAPSSLAMGFAEHVWEHLEPREAATATALFFAYLKPGGLLRLAVPDGFHPSPDYIQWVRPGGEWKPRHLAHRETARAD